MLTGAPVHETARRLADRLSVDEQRDVVVWTDDDGVERVTGLHDYAALFDVPGLYDAVYLEHLGGRAPSLLAQVLTEVVPPQDRSARVVLDVGAGTGAVGEHLVAAGFGPVWAVDLEPASTRAVLRDRPAAHRGARTLDLLALTAEDRAWLEAASPDVVTTAGTVGFGHLPATALAVLVDLLPPGGLLVLTVAPELDRSPALVEHAAVLRGERLSERHRRPGVHRRTADGGELPVLALVLERTDGAR